MAELFVYGTLQHPPLLRGLLSRDVVLRPAVLPGHRAAPLAGRAYPGLVVDASAVARGRLVDVTPDDLDVLDRFEGPDYRRIAVEVAGGDGSRVAAETYVLVETAAVEAVHGSWSLDLFVVADAAHWVAAASAGALHPGHP